MSAVCSPPSAPPRRPSSPAALLRSSLLGVVFWAMAASGDVAVPPRVLDPQSAPEVWNVIRLAAANVTQLLRENRLAEIPVQISLCSPALRALGRYAAPEARVRLGELTTRGAAAINGIAAASLAGDRTAVERDLAAFQKTLQEAAQFFEAAQVRAEIFVCPMHPDCLSPDPATPCAKCGMHLIPRRIPYSFIYMAPGQPSLVLEASTDAPLEAGRTARVALQIKTRSGSPVPASDLMVMHTEPIHLLIVDSSLEDYHHEHPAPTETPGTYAFSFVPRKNGPYRIFADLVPVATGVQEYPFVDLAAAAPGAAVSPAPSTFSTVAGGLRFDLSFPGLPGTLPRAGQVQNMAISVSEADGTPVRRLEPVMNAFAHVVGFHEDYLTVVHLHPTGGDILRQDLRGGPAMGFKFFPPKPGFLRLYCQVLVDGKMIFAPFNVLVAP